MLVSSPCIGTRAVVRDCSNSRAAPCEMLFQQQQQITMMHSEHIQTFAPARGRCTSSSRNGSSAISSLTSVSWPSGMTDGFDSMISGIKGRELSSMGVREGRTRTSVGASRAGDRALQKEEELNLTRVLETAKVGQPEGNRKDGLVDVQIEKLGINSRQIVAKITIEAHLDNVWAILTDYEHLADFIPGLAVSKLLEKRHNGARLYQVGEQNIAMGVKFKAKAVVDCEEKPIMVHENYARRDIDFDTVEGDFQVFRGTWRMEQPVSKLSSSSSCAAPSVRKGRGNTGETLSTILSYILVVQPKLWLPVALVEGRLTTEITTNLVCIRERTLRPSPK